MNHVHTVRHTSTATFLRKRHHFLARIARASVLSTEISLWRGGAGRGGEIQGRLGRTPAPEIEGDSSGATLERRSGVLDALLFPIGGPGARVSGVGNRGRWPKWRRSLPR